MTPTRAREHHRVDLDVTRCRMTERAEHSWRYFSRNSQLQVFRQHFGLSKQLDISERIADSESQSCCVLYVRAGSARSFLLHRRADLPARVIPALKRRLGEGASPEGLI